MAVGEVHRAEGALDGLLREDPERDDGAGDEHARRDVATRELLVRCVLKNKYLWIFAIANFFVYIARYSMLDWGPTYLKEVKGASITDGGLSTMYLEFAGIPSTISDAFG